MEILITPFEEPIQINLNGDIVKIIAFKTAERGNIKFGIEAPRSVKVNREEVFEMIKKQQLE